jgi:hypothetical protein
MNQANYDSLPLCLKISSDSLDFWTIPTIRIPQNIHNIHFLWEIEIILRFNEVVIMTISSWLEQHQDTFDFISNTNGMIFVITDEKEFKQVPTTIPISSQSQEKSLDRKDCI